VVRRASVVSLVDERRAGLASLLESRERRLWAFGFDMDNKKARAWVDSRMPLVLVDSAHRADYENGVRALVDTAGQAASALARCLKEAWFGAGAKVKSNEGDLERLGQLFWATSEGDFYDGLDKLKALLEQGREFWSVEDTEVIAFKEAWLKTLHDRALAIFEEYSQYSQIEQANPKRIALARKNLWFLVGTWAKKMREALELPALERPAKQIGKRGKGEAS
jgi:CRISPR system Cascade subunit CasA